MTFTEEYLKKYKDQIQQLPLGELYEVLDVVRKDRLPDRMVIVENRIDELEEQKAEKSKERKAKKEAPKVKVPRTFAFFDRLTSRFPEPKPQKKLPDIKGLVYFVIFYGFLVPVVFLSVLLVAIMCGLQGFATARDVIAVAEFAMPCVAFVMLVVIRYFLKKERDYKKMFVYWMRHQKLASAIGFYGLLLSAHAFYTGCYRGILCSLTGAHAYEIAAAVLVASLLFVANMFLPISRANRPQNGAVLFMLILAMEYVFRILV